jgi:hypothetical protein
LRALVLIYVWKNDADPSLKQTKFDVAFIVLVILPEITWYIYGNTIIYKPQVKECHDGVSSYLWYGMFAIILYGYVFMLFCLLVLIFAIGLICLHSMWNGSAEVNEDEVKIEEETFKLIPIVGDINQRRTTKMRRPRVGSVDKVSQSLLIAFLLY